MHYEVHLLGGKTTCTRIFQPVPAADHIPPRVAVFAVHGHRHRNTLSVYLPGGDERINGNYIIKRRQVIEPTGKVEDTEVLGVTVDCGKHPEKQLRFHEGRSVVPAAQGLFS